MQIRSNAAETLSITIRYTLAKNPAGWAGFEVMEILAGGVNTSDAIFMVSAQMIRHFRR
jgi:uncharacterized membrane protein YjdF